MSLFGLKDWAGADDDHASDTGSDESGQDHCFAFAPQLPEAQIAALDEQFESFFYEGNRWEHTFKAAIVEAEKNVFGQEGWNPPMTLDWSTRLRKIPVGASITIGEDVPARIKETWRRIGQRMLSDNSVGVIILAGGVDETFESDLPKGMADIGLPSRKSLFQLFCERIVRLQYLISRDKKTLSEVIKAGGAEGQRLKTMLGRAKIRSLAEPCAIPVYIMVNIDSWQTVAAYFRMNGNFGLVKDQVHIFPQDDAPIFDMRGKAILEDKHRICAAPSGTGGLVPAFLNEGVLADAKHRGVEYLHIVCIDNLLTRVADPRFLGFSKMTHSDLTIKSIKRNSSDEELGIIVQKLERKFIMKGRGLNRPANNDHHGAAAATAEDGHQSQQQHHHHHQPQEGDGAKTEGHHEDGEEGHHHGHGHGHGGKDGDEATGHWVEKYIVKVAEFDQQPQDMRQLREEGNVTRYKFVHANGGQYVISLLTLEAIARSSKPLRPHAVLCSKPFIDWRKDCALRPAPTYPEPPNAIRLQTYVTDVSEQDAVRITAALLVNRDEEFALVKGGQGYHVRAVSLGLLSKEHQRWIVAAGGAHFCGFRQSQQADDAGANVCEISPLVSYAGEGLAGAFIQSEPLVLPLYIPGGKEIVDVGTIDNVQRLGSTHFIDNEAILADVETKLRDDAMSRAVAVNREEGAMFEACSDEDVGEDDELVAQARRAEEEASLNTDEKDWEKSAIVKKMLMHVKRLPRLDELDAAKQAKKKDDAGSDDGGGGTNTDSPRSTISRQTDQSKLTIGTLGSKPSKVSGSASQPQAPPNPGASSADASPPPPPEPPKAPTAGGGRRKGVVGGGAGRAGGAPALEPLSPVMEETGGRSSRWSAADPGATGGRRRSSLSSDGGAA